MMPLLRVAAISFSTPLQTMEVRPVEVYVVTSPWVSFFIVS